VISWPHVPGEESKTSLYVRVPSDDALFFAALASSFFNNRIFNGIGFLRQKCNSNKSKLDHVILLVVRESRLCVLISKLSVWGAEKLANYHRPDGGTDPFWAFSLHRGGKDGPDGLAHKTTGSAVPLNYLLSRQV